jgi:peptidoglycan/LPS O-acetylase OafA/YrhL
VRRHDPDRTVELPVITGGGPDRTAVLPAVGGDPGRTAELPVVRREQPDRPLGAFAYQPALDGIRALAVTAVVLFHAGVPGIGGGFLGVDVFFVLSGFLITSLLLEEHRSRGRIDLRRFWLRRARRLLPALLTVVAATVVAAHFLWRGDSDALGLLRTDGYAAVGYVANWRMIFRGTGYVAVTAAPSPLQHTWSLGIEEQFYLVWPLLVAAVLVVRGRGRTVLLVLCGAGAVLSQLLCSWLFRPEDISRAYYGSDTRAQALLIGAALAAAVVSTRQAGRWVSFAGIGGLAVLVWLGHVASDQAAWLYHGGLTFAALATALLILAVVRRPGSRPARFLALGPLVRLGRISYGVYLWHWPLLTFVNADDTGLSRWPLLAVRLAGTLAVATAGYHLIEQPIRHGALGRRLPRHVPIIVTAAAFTVTVFAIVTATAVPPPAATAAAPVVIAPAAPPRAAAHPVRDPAPIDRPGRPKNAGPDPRVTFFGDSVSWVIGDYLPEHPGMWTNDRAIQGCGIATLPDILELGTPHTNYPGCTSWPKRWQKGVRADNPDVAVIELNRWELMDRKYHGRYQHVGDPDYDQYL